MDSDVHVETAMAKLFATELVGKVADLAIQAHGGLGLAKDMPIEFFWRLARVWRIIEGPSESHRITIARARYEGPEPSVFSRS
jgi:alkylation response protein AidB-like acyl-CoA dehydrogenase